MFDLIQLDLHTSRLSHPPSKKLEISRLKSMVISIGPCHRLGVSESEQHTMGLKTRNLDHYGTVSSSGLRTRRGRFGGCKV